MKILLNLIAFGVALWLGSASALAQANPCPAQIPPDLARQALNRAVSEMLPDEREQFIRRAEGRPGGSASLFCAEAIDLNRDGRRELLIGPAGPEAASELCAATGGCPSWIYRRTASDYELIWEGISGVDVLRSVTNGYRDLRTEAHATNAEREITIYKFDGRRYRPSICTTQTWVGSRRGRDVFRYRRHRCEEQ